MKGKTLKQITNTPKAGLKELLSLPNNEDFNIEVTSKESGKKYTVSTNILGSGGLESVIAGDNITIDDTDPQNPIISATGTGGGGSPAGSDNQIQINQSGSFFADSTF